MELLRLKRGLRLLLLRGGLLLLGLRHNLEWLGRGLLDLGRLPYLSLGLQLKLGGEHLILADGSCKLDLILLLLLLLLVVEVLHLTLGNLRLLLRLLRLLRLLQHDLLLGCDWQRLISRNTVLLLDVRCLA